jgi:hypothetical protein
MNQETELVWTKKGIDYVLKVADGHLFVRGWRKRRVAVSKKPEEEIPEALDKITDVVLKYRPKDKKKKPRKRKKYEKPKEKEKRE